MKYVASNSVNVRELSSIKSKKLNTYYRGHIIEKIGAMGFDENNDVWTQVDNGWVYANALNEYIEESPEMVRVPPAIKTAGHIGQYIVWEGSVKYNLCGEFCAAYLGQDEIHWFLSKWRTSSPQNYTVGVIQDKPMGISSVKTMLDVYKLVYVDAILPLTDKYLGFFCSPERIGKLLQKYKLLCGVKIGNDGKLNTGTIGHWIVLENIEPLRNGDGIVTIYNPYPNRLQKYSYAEFIKSVTGFGGFSGVWVNQNE